MAFNIAIKGMISLTVGFIYWFWAFMVFMVYSFMPVSKTFNSIIFTGIAPLLYLSGTSWLITRIFKEKGWKSILANVGISIGAMIISIAVIDTVGRLVR